MPPQERKWRVAACDPRDRAGLGSHVHQGKVPAPSQRVARAVATDVGRPPRAGRRIAREDGPRGPAHARWPQTERVERATVAGAPGLGRLGPHPGPKGVKRLRAAGVQATRTGAKGQGLMHEAVAKVEGGGKGALKSMVRLTSRQRDAQSTGRDPWIGAHWRGEMGVWRLWHPTSGGISDAVPVSTRGP